MYTCFKNSKNINNYFLTMTLSIWLLRYLRVLICLTSSERLFQSLTVSMKKDASWLSQLHNLTQTLLMHCTRHRSSSFYIFDSDIFSFTYTSKKNPSIKKLKWTGNTKDDVFVFQLFLHKIWRTP